MVFIFHFSHHKVIASSRFDLFGAEDFFQSPIAAKVTPKMHRDDTPLFLIINYHIWYLQEIETLPDKKYVAVQANTISS